MGRPKKDGVRATGIYAKKGHLYVVVSLPRFENGKKISKKIWISTGLEDRKENVSEAIRLRERYLQKNTAVDMNIDISATAIADRFLEAKAREVMETTYLAYEYKIRHFQNHFGNTPFRRITREDLEFFLDKLFREGKSERTVKDIKVILGGLYTMAKEAGIVNNNIMEKISLNRRLLIESRKDEQTGEDFFSLEEMKRFLDICKDDELRDLYYVTWLFALRREEVLGIRWRCIDFKEKTLSICHTVTKGRRGVNKLNTTKTEASARIYPLNDELIDLFLSIRDREAKNRMLFKSGYEENDYVFKRVNGTLYHPDRVSKSFKKIIKKHPDLPQKITFHGLRKSCISFQVRGNIDFKNTQNWAGQKDVETTLGVYAKTKAEEGKKEVLEYMTKALKG